MVHKSLNGLVPDYMSSKFILRSDLFNYNTIQYKFYCQLPMGAFQRQVLIVQVIKKKKKKVSQIDYQ